MPTVVLVGFSTTGKSTLANTFKTRYPLDNLQVMDTDTHIAVPDGMVKGALGEAYAIFEALVKEGDRTAAIRCIEQEEDKFLNGLHPVDHPRLIAAGPGIPSREHWAAFYDRVKPVCFCLHKSPSQVYETLIARRRAARADIQAHPLFGAWDEDILTQYEQGRWVEVDREAAIANIEKHMQPLHSIYATYCDDHHTFATHELIQSPAKLEHFFQALQRALSN